MGASLALLRAGGGSDASPGAWLPALRIYLAVIPALAFACVRRIRSRRDTLIAPKPGTNIVREG